MSRANALPKLFITYLNLALMLTTGFVYLPAFASDNLAQGYHPRAASEEEFNLIARQYDSETRKAISLNGEWSAKLISENDSATVQVPGSYDFYGEVEFVRGFELDSTLATSALELIALGINNSCKIFLNGNFLTSHVAGHAPFSVRLPAEMLLPGEANELRIVVDNTLSARHTLPLKYRPGLSIQGGGIFRDIFLLSSPLIAIESVKLAPAYNADSSVCTLSATVVLEKDDRVAIETELADIRLQAVLYDSSGARQLSRVPSAPVAFDRRRGTSQFTFEIRRPEFWSPSNPYRYRLQVRLMRRRQILDEKPVAVGLSHVAISGGALHLNGRKLRVLGVDWVEDFAAGNASATLSQLDADILEIKRLGANTIRVIGTPPHPYLMEACDREGILVFMELPLSFVPDSRFRDPSFVEMVSNYLSEMLERYSKHPSLAAWGIGTDLALDQPATARFISGAERLVRRHSSRPVYAGYRHLPPTQLPEAISLVCRTHYAVDPTMTKPLSLGNADPNQAELASIGVSFRAPPLKSAANGNAPVAATKFDESHIAAQELQAYQLNRNLTSAMADTSGFGILIHTYADWHLSSPSLVFGVRPNTAHNPSGLSSLNREKRLARDVVEGIFKQSSPRKLSVRLPEQESPSVYPIVGLGLVLVFLFNFNRSRRLRGNLKRIFSHPHGFYTEVRENRKVPSGHTFLLSILTTAVLSILLSSIIFNLRMSLMFDEILDLVVASAVWKQRIIWLAWQPGVCLAILSALLYTLFFCAVVLLKVTGFLLGRSLPFGQYATILFWACASFVWLLPVAPIFYRVIDQTPWTPFVLAVVVLFVLWFSVRLFRAVKVVLGLSWFRSVLLFAVALVVVGGGLGLYYDQKSALFDYVPMYWDILRHQLPFLL